MAKKTSLLSGLMLASALCMAAPCALAQEKLLMERDYTTWSEADYALAEDITCISAIDIYAASQGKTYDAQKLADWRDFYEYDYLDNGGTDADLAANLELRSKGDKAAVAAGRATAEFLMEDCARA